MTQVPVTVTYSLEEMLGRIDQKLDRLANRIDSLDHKIDAFGEKFDQKLTEFRKDVDTKFDSLQKDVVELKVGQARLETEVKGINQRLDTQEFISRSVVVGLVLAVLAGVVKLFLPNLSI